MSNGSNCVCCLIRPLVSFSFALFASIKPLCSHVDPLVKLPTLRTSCLGRIVCLGSFLILCCQIYFSLEKVKKFSNVFQANTFRQLLYDLMGWNTLVYFVNFYLFNEKYISTTKFLMYYAEKSKFFGVFEVLPSNVFKKVSRIIFIFKCFCILYCFICSLGFCLEEEKFDFKTAICELGATIIFITLSSIFAYVLLLIQIYLSILRSIFLSLINVLQIKILQSSGTPRQIVDNCLLKKIQLLHVYYIVICNNYKRHILSFGNLFYYLVLFLTTVSLGILSNIFMYNFIKHPVAENIFDALDLILRWIGFVWFSFICFCYYTDLVAKSVSKFIICSYMCMKRKYC